MSKKELLYNNIIEISSDSDSQIESRNNYEKNKNIFQNIEKEEEAEQENEINYRINNLISKNSSNIEIIYHISDLHIENNPNNYNEYDFVFNKLYKIILNDKNSNKLLVITGDILHEKTKLYTETILYTWNLLKKINKIIPIIMIPGNHDLNMRNNEKKDGLTGILYDRITSEMEIHYLLYSGLYKYRNILFCIQSLSDLKIINFKKIKSDENLIKIALYHGILNGSKNGIGFNFVKARSIRDFIEYDFALLGDIHCFQFLRKNIAYAGSLMCQDFGEGNYDHGCIRWDIKDKNHQFIPILDIFSFKTIKIYNDQIELNEKLYKLENLPIEEIPSYGKLKIIFMNKNFIEFNLTKLKLTDFFKSKYNKLSISFEEEKEKSNYSNIIQENIKSNSYVNENLHNLFWDYININFLNEEPLNVIKKNENFLLQIINEQIYKKYKCKLWRILSVKWNNLFIYGINNFLNFEKTKNIIGLIGRNSSGKSLFLEIILYLLYGRDRLKEKNKNDLINNKETNFSGEIIIEINNEKILIKRKGAKTNKSFDESLEIKKLNNYEEGSNLYLENKRASQQYINELLGKYDDIRKINFMFQNEDEKIYNMSKKERKDYFYRVLNIDFMQEKFVQINEVRQKLEKKKIELETLINRHHLDEDQYASKEELEKNKQNLEIMNSKINDLDIKKKNIQNKIENLNRKFLPDYKIPFSKKELYYQNREKKKKTNKLKTKIKNKKDRIKSKLKNNNFDKKNKKLKNRIKILKQKNEDIDKNNFKIKENINENEIKLKEMYRKMSVDMTIIKSILHDIKNDKKVDKTRIDKINLDLFDKICNLNEKNLEKMKMIEEQNKLKILSEKKIEKLRTKIDLNYSRKQKIYKLKDRIRFINNQFKNEINEIKQNNIFLKQYRENEKNFETNQNNNKELKTNKKDLEEIEGELMLLLRKRANLESKINRNEKYINENELRNKQYIEIIKTINESEILMRITSVNGFPYFLLNQYIEKISNNMNEIFGVYFKRHIKIYLEKESIDFKIINENGKECSLMGGCEGLLFELAFRISISKIMKIPLANILFIDEHLSVIDFEKRYEIKRIFDHINSYFDKIFVITHDETIVNYVDECINIRQNDQSNYLNNDY